jgi:hypothetical protein
MDMGLTWVYGTGVAFTAPISNYQTLGSQFEPAPQVTEYTDRNSLRLPAYHRLDLGINFHKKTKWGKRTWNISVYNAYNRRNPYYLYINQNGDGTGDVRQVSLFPIIPSVSYIFQF